MGLMRPDPFYTIHCTLFVKGSLLTELTTGAAKTGMLASVDETLQQRCIFSSSAQKIAALAIA